MEETIRENTDTERRGSVIRSQSLDNFERGMNRTTETKRFGIPKSIVWEAYKKIKANQGSGWDRRRNHRVVRQESQ